jgi:FkbM family methyltransferase
MRLGSSIKYVLKTAWRYKNWIHILFSNLQYRPITKVSLRDGITLSSPKNGDLFAIVNEIFFRRSYTNNFFSIGENDLVVDIGANIGIFSVWASLQTKNLVYAFEPFSPNCDFIEKNIANNALKNVIVQQTAVSDKTGKVRLYLAESRGGNLLFDHNIQGRLEEYVDVPSTTLKAFMESNNFDSIDFLKMDCEGSEGVIFSSTPAAYLARIRKIALEYHDNVSLLKHHEIQDLLKGAGFHTLVTRSGNSPFGYILARNTTTIH